MKNRKINVIVLFLLILISIIIIDKNLNSINLSSIAIGNKILKNGIFVNEDFTWVKGIKYENVNWLFNISISLIYNKIGFLGIYSFYILLTSFIGLTIYVILTKQNNSKFLSIIITIFTIILAKNIFNNGIYSITLLIFILHIFFIDRLFKTGKYKYMLYIFLLTILLTNINANVYPILFLMYLPYIIESVIIKNNIFKNDEKIIIDENNNIYLLLLSMFSVFIGGSINPLSWSPYLNLFREYKMINNLKLFNLELLNNLNIFFMMIIIVPVLIISLTNTKIRVIELNFIIIISLLVFYNLDLYYFIFCLILVLAKIITRFLENYNYSISDFIKVLTCFFGVLIILGYAIITINNNKDKDYINKKENPVLAVNYIKDNIDTKQMHIYNNYKIGDYMEYMNVPTLLDSRKEIFFYQNNYTNIFYDLFCAGDGKENFDEIFYNYNINYALLKKDEIIKKYINDYNNWELVYEDDSFSLYRKIN